MSEKSLATLFGDVTLVQAIMWVAAAFGLVVFLVWAWPKISAAVRTLDMIASLEPRMKSVDDRLAALDGVPEKLERVRNQVENSHDTNLREELDSRHAETLSLIRGVQKDFGRLDQREILAGKKIDGLDQKLDAHIEWSRGQKDRIDDLERTQDLNKEK